MPELPEVETIRADLAEVLPGDTIAAVTATLPKILRGVPAERWAAHLEGLKLAGVRRRAKLLIIDFADSSDSLLIHLKMTGQLFWQDKEAVGVIAGGHTQGKPDDNFQLPNKYTHATFEFESGARLYFNDLRQFGYLEIAGPERVAAAIKKFGREPLDKDFTLDYLAAGFERRPRSILKAALLDQGFIAGLGNIYVDEICFRAGVRPDRRVGTLDEEEIERLWRQMPIVLKEAIKARGTTFNTYRDSKGRRGSFTRRLRVYGRGGQPCVNCGTAIIKTKVAGRGTHYCPRCQK